MLTAINLLLGSVWAANAIYARYRRELGMSAIFAGLAVLSLGSAVIGHERTPCQVSKDTTP